MARKKDEGSCGGLLFIIVIIGNIFLFSGTPFVDSNDNYLVWICVFVAAVADISLIIHIITTISNSVNRTTQIQYRSRESQTPRVSASSGQQNSVSCLNAEQNRNETEAKKKESETDKIESIIKTFTVSEPPLIPYPIIDPFQKEMEAYRSREIEQMIKKVNDHKRSEAKKLLDIKKEIEGILACPACTSNRQRKKYLDDNEEKLLELKREYYENFKKLNNTRVRLLSRNEKAFYRLRTALEEISKCEKIEAKSDTSYDAFVILNAKLPGNCFATDQDPIELSFGGYLCFLLSDVVLVYSNKREFITALEPLALIISFTERQRKASFSNNGLRGWTTNDSIIASDSKLVTQEYHSTSWLHTKKNGGPDLRYSYNPRYEYKSGVYAYTECCFQLGQYKEEFSISNGMISKKLQTLIKEYCSISHESNPIPSLLRLLEVLARNKDSIVSLSNRYESVCRDVICKEVVL